MNENKTFSAVMGAISITLAIISIFVFWWLSIVGLVFGILGFLGGRKTVPACGCAVCGICFLITLIMLLAGGAFR